MACSCKEDVELLTIGIETLLDDIEDAVSDLEASYCCCYPGYVCGRCAALTKLKPHLEGTPTS